MAVVINDNSIMFENSFLKKEVFINKNRITSARISNKLSGSYLDGFDKSEEFSVCFKKGLFKSVINASELKIDNIESNTEGNLNKITVFFKNNKVKGSEIKLSLVYEFYEDKPYFNKYVTIFTGDKKTIVLDSIELGGTMFGATLKNWCLPKQKKSHIPGIGLEMGQPVYVDSFYFGCEFPAAINTIRDNIVSVRTFSGKALTELCENGSYKSYKYVCGVSPSDNFAEVQKSFYSYIRNISKPVKLRIQYNSWFDNMLNITEENVTSSFLEVEKGLTSSGVRAIDSYVADDGWNDYSKGFWTFNSKFPERLTPFKNLSESLGSRFGVWVGPRGGYTTDTIKFARHIENAGNGYVNKQAHDICVASEKYARKTGDMMLEFIDSFNLNYFKLDGFAQYPCKSKKHDHMVGGYNDMYFYTDLWEKWISLFEKMNAKGGEDFFINLTCYAPPSPWFLQWVNSIWMQISNDVDFIGKEKVVSDKDRMLSYRDDCYFDFYTSRQFQLPQRSLYNHDPIYGNEAKVSMNDDDFREYLFTMAMRGTSFWELYYSHNMMNEAKWRINRSVLSFLEDNMDVLSNSVIFGSRPSLSQVYGFSCFNEKEGIVCLRNSADRPMDYVLKLDENIGVNRSFKKSDLTVILPYTVKQSENKYGYGDSLAVSLKAYETKIFHFNKSFKPIIADYAKALNENTLEVSFNQFINAQNITCDENEITDIKLLEDYMSVRITFKNSFNGENKIILKNVADIMCNITTAELEFDCCENNIVLYSLKGKTEFSVKATLDNSDPKVIMKQGGEIQLEIREDGHIYFTVGTDVLISRASVTDIVQVTAVRERNGVMKLYLNGKLDSGRKSLNTYLCGDNAYVYDNGRVKIYNKAFSFDEV